MIQGVSTPRSPSRSRSTSPRALLHLRHGAAGGREAGAGRGVLGNTELCRITEDLIFTDPYMVCSRNRWTSPQLDDVAAEIREDAALKRAVSALKLKFLSEAQALLHGDLHTGSIMVTEEDTKVIDPEFAVMGPMGFDVGKLLGNLLMSFFSQRGHERAAGERDAYRGWILSTVADVWDRFDRRFVELWTAYPTGDGYPAPLFDGAEGRASLREAQAAYMRRLFEDVRWASRARP